jgi:hypothetical protein
MKVQNLKPATTPRGKTAKVVSAQIGPEAGREYRDAAEIALTTATPADQVGQTMQRQLAAAGQ